MERLNQDTSFSQPELNHLLNAMSTLPPISSYPMVTPAVTKPRHHAFQNKSPLNYLWTVNMIWLFPLFHGIPLSEIWSSTSDVCVLSRYRQGCFTRSREIISQWPSHTLRSFTEIISPSGPSKSIQYIWMNKSRSWLLCPSTSFQYPKVSPL